MPALNGGVITVPLPVGTRSHHRPATTMWLPHVQLASGAGRSSDSSALGGEASITASESTHMMAPQVLRETFMIS
eukprot:5102407-Prymnesium_polylepis.3